MPMPLTMLCDENIRANGVAKSSCIGHSLSSALAELEHGTGYQAAPLPHKFCALLKQNNSVQVIIEIDDIKKTLPISHMEMVDFLLPLCCWLRGLTVACTDSTEKRIIIAMVGPAGAGKSTLANIITYLCNRIWEEVEGSDWAIALSMDAYHLPNSVLESNMYGKHTWKELKGHGFTIDSLALSRDLELLRFESGKVELPIYNRVSHEPLHGHLTAQSHHRLVILEGLHLLRRDNDWAKVNFHIKRSIFLNIPRSVSKQRVVTRKVLNGRRAEDAEAHFTRVDGPIYDTLSESSMQAHIILSLTCTPNHLMMSSFTVKQNIDYNKICSVIENQSENSTRGMGNGIYFLGLNPAIQQWFHLPDRIQSGGINRAMVAGEGVGGKGQNAAHVIGTKVRKSQESKLAIIMFGKAKIMKKKFNECGVTMISVSTHSSMRTCVTILGSASTTEIVGPWGGPIGEDECCALLEKVRNFPHGNINGLAIMGSNPIGVADEYAALILNALPIPKNCCILLDTTVGLKYLLEFAANHGFKIGLKVNANEIFNLSKKFQLNENKTMDDLEEKDVISSACSMLQEHSALKFIAVTNGNNPSLLIINDGLLNSYWRFSIPMVQVINCTGAGDCMTAILLKAWSAGNDLIVSMIAGICAASASCLSVENSLYCDRAAIDMIKDVEVQRVWDCSRM